MNRKQLVEQIRKKESYLCVGLDTDLTKLPDHFKKNAQSIVEFNKQIIDATHQYAVAYKPNIAFYEALGTAGWDALEETLEYIPKDVFTIADAKRGDIANTSTLYAQTFFETYQFDSVTVAPYMGVDSVKPFLKFDDKWVILLAHTSNKGAYDFQTFENKEGKKIYEEVLEKSQEWGTTSDLMYVVGATKAEALQNIRKYAPDHFLLVPGVGAQGGSLEEVSKYGMIQNDCGLLVNSSRGILFADASKDFAKASKKEAERIQTEMRSYLNLYG